MRKHISFILFALILTACNKPGKTVLPFDTHPSIFRGDWAGEIWDYPNKGQITPISSKNLVANFCEEPIQKQCETYTFTGTVQIGTSNPISITGEGFSGGAAIYALRTPPPPIKIKASFSLNGIDHKIEADYWNDQYTGMLYIGEDSYYFLLSK